MFELRPIASSLSLTLVSNTRVKGFLLSLFLYALSSSPAPTCKDLFFFETGDEALSPTGGHTAVFLVMQPTILFSSSIKESLIL